MKALVPKSTLLAERRDTPGLPPRSPDKQLEPSSARAGARRDATHSQTQTADLDRRRRLARSDAQGRYGNTEVARVALRQNPAPIGARRVPAGALTEAGAVAKHSRGHGKPSAHPGAARAAVEVKHRGDKKEPDKREAKKDQPEKGKGVAAKGAAELEETRVAKKAEKEEGGTAREEGAEGRAAAAPPFGAAGGGAALELPSPPPRPRLEGTEAVALSIPQLAAEQHERVRLQSGFTIEEHFARVQVQLDRLSARATSEQFAIVVHIELLEQQVRRDLDNAAALIKPAVAAGIDTVRGACAAARAGIDTASKNALDDIEKHASAADKKVDAATLTTKDAVEKAVAASSPQVRGLYEETMQPLRELLAKKGERFVEIGKTQGNAMVDKGKEIAEALERRGGSDIDIAIYEKQGQAAKDQAELASKDLVAAGERGQKEILAQEATFGLSFLMLVNPIAVKVEKVGADDKNNADAKGGEVRLRLATDYERAKGFVEETQKRAVKALDALEHSAVERMEQIGRSLEEMACARREQICNAILAAREPAAQAWAQQMSGVNELAPPGQILDWRRLDPRFVEAMDSMNALSTHQRLDFDAQARSGFDETRAAMDGDRASIDEAVSSYVDSAAATRAQSTGIRQVATRFVEGFHGVAQPASATVGEFRTRAEEKLGLTVEDTRKQMAKLLKESGGSMEESIKKFDTALGDQVNGLEAHLAKTFEAVAQDVPADLGKRAGDAYEAMDRIGTWETQLFESLYGMTPKYGRALCEYWNRADHAHDLWWWLDDELSGDEYTTAYYYLLGDPVTAIRYQLKASIHWYGDDVKQMESGLRALTPDQLKELRKDPAFAEVKDTLRKNLKGTNLQVAEALIAGRTARADALRLKEQIDAARAAGNDDRLHDILASVDAKRLPEVRTEFMDILAGNVMTDKPPVPPADKAALDKQNAEFTVYITKPVRVYEPGRGRGEPGHYVTKTLGEPSRKLAEALATTGEGSPESRAARLAYEKSRGGKPRPERLAKALDDPELVAARKNPILTKPDADPRELAAAKDELDRLEARRADMMNKFAELNKADAAIKNDPAILTDPKRAQAYTEKAVADMFGEDELGRELGTSMVQKGRANAAVAIKYAVRGWGTNEELIRQTLRGMSKEEIAELKQEYAQRFSGDKYNPNALYDDLGVFQNASTAKAAGVEHATGGGFFTELSGDERQEVEELLLGKPESDRDRMRLARLKYAHQRGEGTTWVGTALMAGVEEGPLGVGLTDVAGMGSGSAITRSLDMNKARMEEMIVAAGGEEKAFDENGSFKGVPGRYSPTDFRVHTAATSEMAENYKHHVDSLVDMITGAIALIGAIVGTIVVTVLTLGTATPLVVAAWAAGIALATGAAVMATKYALKGSRYGWEEAAVDAAVTLVDAATAGLTAGAGAKAARAAAEIQSLKSLASTPAQKAVFENLAKQQARKELARGFVRAAAGAGASGATRTGLADGTWDEGFMTGLGRTVSGGAKAAAIGMATHGASHVFSTTGVARGLSESKSFLARGFGAGVGGALGGMAGRSAELTLDALGGHSQLSWYEALGDIALAGGRGFAENFGQGVASVPKAQRDAAQARLENERKASEAERVARARAAEGDEVADLKFRRIAVAAALANDPRTNAKAFLAELDAAVAQDRTIAEAHRQLLRDFRREALASIPRERRGEFADVPIHILPDAEFERFTGSLSGRAVTIIVDGEPQIVVRRSATPESLREEGIHVLQSRDPKWRERIALLDEATMARWNELDLDTQLSLYRNKVEIEIDAQRRLRQDLIDEAERAPDPARRDALFARAKDSEHTLAALEARHDEVSAIGPERRTAIRRGDEARPQYLREPARLFAKRARPPEMPERPAQAPPTEELQGPAAKRGVTTAEPTEPRPLKDMSLHELRSELTRLRGIASTQRTATDAARIAVLEGEISGRYVLRPGESVADLEARVLARRGGETDAVYRKRLASLQTEVADAAQRLGLRELKGNYERLLRSLKRPVEAVRREVAELESVPPEMRTDTQNARLFAVLGELEAHYSARPGETGAAVEARLLARGLTETDAQYQQRLIEMRAEIAHNAVLGGRPGLAGRVEILIEQMQRPLQEVREAIDKIESLDRDLNSDEIAQLKALQRQLQAHYMERPGESHAELEQRLFAQHEHEKLEDYLVRLKNSQEEVFSSVQRTGSERVLDHYLKLVDEVETDVARLPHLEEEIRQAKADWEHAARCNTLHVRAMRGLGPSPNVPHFLRSDVEALWEHYNSLVAERDGLRNRSTARSARYQFSDIGRVDPCFLPGTLVMTPGGTRPIDDFREGDDVLARATAGAPIRARVARVHRNATQAVVTLHVAGETIRTTRQHPFWSVTRNAWAHAAALEPGELLLTLSGPAPLTGSTTEEELAPTLNLEIAGMHTFLVGASGALVHNATKRPDFSDPIKRPTRIYRVVRTNDDGTRTVIYIGKTFQGDRGDVQTRFEQHLESKPEWAELAAQKGPDGTPRLVVELEESGSWTVFETAVWEEHFIRKYRLNRVDLERIGVDTVDLENKGVPLTKESFNRYRGRFRGC